MLLTKQWGRGIMVLSISNRKRGDYLSRQKRTHPPYDRFRGLLTEKGLAYKDVAELLGISVTSVGAKINGSSYFLLSEAQAIKREYRPERDIFCNLCC